MTNTKHTPGPWIVQESLGQRDVVSEEMKAVVCGYVYSNDDAHLIAAAPEMLEALARIADMRDRDGNAIEMHREEMRGISRAAIAKATGANQ